MAINQSVALAVALEFAGPEIRVRRRGHAVLKPRSPVPKVSVHEHRKPNLSEGEVWCAEDPRVVPTEAKSKSFERDTQPLFWLRLRSPHRPHDAAPRFFVELVGHVRVGPHPPSIDPVASGCARNPP
jgi:hypothetical protein